MGSGDFRLAFFIYEKMRVRNELIKSAACCLLLLFACAVSKTICMLMKVHPAWVTWSARFDGWWAVILLSED